jgi:hypothetical protein
MDRLYGSGEVGQLVLDGVCGAAVTTIVAAEIAGVAAATVRSWAHRGKLQPVGYDTLGRALYDAADVIRVERDTRRACAGRPRLQH